MGYNDDEPDHPHPWKRALWEARRAARQAEAAIPDTTPRAQVLDAPPEQRLAHRYVLDYASHLEPHQNVFDEKWAEELVAQQVPIDGSSVSLESDLWGEYDSAAAITKAPWQSVGISLQTLRTQWQQSNECRITVEVDDDVVEHQRRVLHLSPKAISATLAQLDRCLADIGWVPKPETQNRRAGSGEVLTHE